ncbi:MAG: arylsulfatase B [bacterium]
MKKILLATLALCLAGVSLAAAEQKPNVVIIVSDDHGFGDIGWNNPEAKTPVLNRLAAEGARLDRFYSNPICSVTRAALMSGIATIKTSVNNRQGLDLKYRILPQVFKDAGYQTWMFGKWHLGGSEDNTFNTPEYMPHKRGFDYFYGFLHGAIDYYTHERKDLGKLDWQRNGKPVVEEGFTTDLLADDARRMIQERDKSKPFLLYLPFNGVHGPLQTPPGAAGGGQAKNRDRRGTLLANIAHLDKAVGRLVKTIEEEKIDKNTIILFFGDNGGQLSNGASNGELRGEKNGTFEGGIREPALIYWPGVIAPGQKSQQFMCAMDVLPTLSAAAGIATGMKMPIDGANLWPALKSGKAESRPPFVMGFRDTALFSGDWKMVSPGQGQAPLLFDIVKDPNEKNDLAAKNPEVVARLSKELEKLTDGASRRQGGGGGGGNLQKKAANKKGGAQGKGAQKKKGQGKPAA